MSGRSPVIPRHAYKLLNHGPTTLVTSAHQGRSNVMAAAWVMPLDFDPPKLVAIVAAGTLTRELVEASGELVVNVPARSLADATYAVGTSSGHEADKFARFGIATEPASIVGAPYVRDAVAWLECRVIPEPHMQTQYDLFVLEVIAAFADDRVFADGQWTFPEDELRTLHHTNRGIFHLIGERLQAKPPR